MRVIDVRRHPERAEAEHIMALPTIVCESDSGKSRVVGDLKDAARVIAELMVPHTFRNLRSTPVRALPREHSVDDESAGDGGQLDLAGRVVEYSFDPVVVVDAQGLIRFANPAAQELLGHGREELVGRQFGFPMILGREIEVCILRPDRSKVTVELRAAPIKSRGCNFYAAYFHDVTSRKATEAALRSSEERWRLMVENVCDFAIIPLDCYGRVADWNDAAARVTGFESEHVLGKGLEIFHCPEDVVSRKAERLLAGVKARERVEDEGWRRRSDGSVYWANVVLVAVRDADGVIVGFRKMVRDLTQRKELERIHLENQKRAIVAQLAHGLAHRFNNLMCGLTMGSELLLLKLGELDEMRELAASMKASAVHAARITEGFVAFAGRGEPRLQEVDLRAVLQDAESSIRELLGSMVTLRIDHSRQDCRTHVDPHQMEVLLSNLAANARDAMPLGGEFRIEIGLAEPDAAFRARFPEAGPKQHVRLAALDTGGGLNEEAMAHLFEPFFTTKGPKHDGLGLAVCEAITRQNGGQISVRSQPGSGALVEVFFPAADRTSADRSIAVAASRRGLENILLVDHNASLRKAVAGCLEALNYNVIQADCPEDGVNLIRSDSTFEIHAILMEGRVRPRSGKALIREVHAHHPEARVLYLSRLPLDPAESSIVPEYGVVVLPKPFTLEILAGKLREVLDN